MRTSRVLHLLLTVSVMTVVSNSVFAQTPATNSSAVSEAEVKDSAARVSSLNKQATALMDAGDFAKACPKLEEAVRLAPEAAIGARLNLAECYVKLGRASMAYTQYSAAATLAERAGQEERLQLARNGMKALQTSVGVLKLEVPEELSLLPGLVLTLDGVEMPELRWVRAIGLDAGVHKIEVSATDRVKRSFRVEGQEPGKVVTARIPVPDRADSTAGVVAAATPTPGPTEGRAASVGPAEAAPEPRNKVPGFVGLGVGGAALVTGVVLVGLAVGVPAEINSQLPKDVNGNSQCPRIPQSGEDAVCAGLRSKAEAGSLMGNVGVGLLVGGGFVAAASVVYLVLSSSRATARGKTGKLVPVVGQTGVGLVWTGSF